MTHTEPPEPTPPHEWLYFQLYMTLKYTLIADLISVAVVISVMHCNTSVAAPVGFKSNNKLLRINVALSPQCCL